MKKIVSALAVAALLTAAAGSSAFASETTPKGEAPEGLTSLRIVRAVNAESGEIDGEVFYTVTLNGEDVEDANGFFQFNEDAESGEEEAFYVTFSDAEAIDLEELITSNEDLTAEEKDSLLALIEEAQPLEDRLTKLYEKLPDADEAETAALLDEIDSLHEAIQEIYDREEELFEKSGVMRSVTVSFADDGEFEVFDFSRLSDFEELYIPGLDEPIRVETAPALTLPASKQ